MDSWLHWKHKIEESTPIHAAIHECPNLVHCSFLHCLLSTVPLITVPPHNLVLEPEESEYYPGDTIICLATGKPTPVIWWRDLATNLTVESDTLIITEAMFNASQAFKCIASNEVKGQPMEDTRIIIFTVVSEWFFPRCHLQTLNSPECKKSSIYKDTYCW